MQRRFSNFAYCLEKIRIFKKSRPFCSARPCSAATSLKFPPDRINRGNLRCCCSAGVAPRGFACGELDYLRDCFRCSFLFFLPPPLRFLSSPNFYGDPPPPDLSPTLPPLLSPPSSRPPRPRHSPRKTTNCSCAAYKRGTTATQLSDPTCIGWVKIALRLLCGLSKTCSLGAPLQTRIRNFAHHPQIPALPKTTPFF